MGLLLVRLRTVCQIYHNPQQVDDTSYLRVDKLLIVLQNAPQAYAYIGNMQSGVAPDRNPQSKWFVPESLWQWDG